MGRIRDEHARALMVATIGMIFFDDQRANQFALRASCGHERYAGKSSDLSQHILELIHKIEIALNAFDRLMGVNMGKTRVTAGNFVDLGIVFHGTGAKRVKTKVNGVVLLRHTGEMAHSV